MFCFGDAMLKMVAKQLLTMLYREETLISIWDERVGG